MKEHKVLLTIAIILLTQQTSLARNEIIEDFIASSNNSITFVSVDEATSNSTLVVNKFNTIPKTILQLNSSALKNCSNYANIDFYDNKTTHATRFKSDCKLEDFLYFTEFTDFLIFTPSKFIALILKCIVQPQSRYLVIPTTMTTLQPSSITHMLNETWVSNGALKVFLIQQDTVVTFNPFHRNDDGSYGKLNSFAVPFGRVESRIRNLNGYPLRIELWPATFTIARFKGTLKSVDDFNGTDADIAKTVKTFLNATMPIYKNDGAKFGYKYPNGTFTGALKSIRERKSDVAFVTFFIKDYETRNIEFTASVYADDLCLVVKKAERIPQFMMPLITFDNSLWIALGVFSVIAITIWSMIRFINNKIFPAVASKRIQFNLPSHMVKMPMFIQYTQILIDTLILIINAPLRRFPRIQSERVYTATICLLSLNIISVFQSGLATCYVQPLYYKNVQSLQEFADTGKKILVKYPAMMTDTFPVDSSELYRTLYHRMVLVPNTTLTAYDVLYRKNMAGITRRTTLKVQKEDEFAHLIPECPKNYHLSYIISKHWIFAETINEIILYLKQAGLITQWIEEVNFRVKLESIHSQTSAPRQRPLQVDDLMLSYMILGVGFFMALILFIMEVYMKRRIITEVFQYLP